VIRSYQCRARFKDVFPRRAVGVFDYEPEF
jgi:hypothetical protein